MARVPYLRPEDLTGADRELLLQRPLSLYKALMHSPKAATALQQFAMCLRNQSPLDRRLRELAILQVGWLARAPYEWAHHLEIGMEAGVTEADVRALIDDTAGKPTQLDSLSRQVLRAAREMTTDGAMSEASFSALHAALGTQQVMDLTLIIALYNAVVRVLATLQIDLEDNCQHWLQKFPLPR